jgi:hypothetical protein
LVLGGLNMAALTGTFLSGIVARGYHLSVDFTDGQMLLIYCLVFATPVLTLASLASAAAEWRSADRLHVLIGLVLNGIPALFLLLVMASVGLLQGAVQWLVGS